MTKKIIFLLFMGIILTSCSSIMKRLISEDGYTIDGMPAQITLSGQTISTKNTIEKFWDAYDYSGTTRFRFGILKNQSKGFVLYNETDGEFTKFCRAGLDFRWDWDNYAIILEPDGTALYVDFSVANKDGIANPRATYKTKEH